MNSLTKVLKRLNLIVARRGYVTAAIEKYQDKRKRVREWHVQKYGNLDDLVFRDDCRKPRITEATEVMIKVHAASVNPIDVAMIKGYGSNFLNLSRKCMNQPEFPLGMIFIIVLS